MGLPFTFPIHRPPEPEPAWDEAARIYRRICWLRADGHGAEADQASAKEFAAAVAAVYLIDGDNPETAGRMETLQAAEESRAADAVAFAEVLAPLVAERLPDRADRARPTGRGRPEPAPRVPSSGRGPRGIADLIDEMLEQTKNQ